MTFLLYDYVRLDGVNDFKSWSKGLEKVQKAKLAERLDKLHLHGDGLFPEILTNTAVPGILKLRVRGNVQLRPLLCRGPVSPGIEFTMLMGAKEIGDKWSPAKAPVTAKTRREEVKADPNNRRNDHETVT